MSGTFYGWIDGKKKGRMEKWVQRYFQETRARYTLEEEKKVSTNPPMIPSYEEILGLPYHS